MKDKELANARTIKGELIGGIFLYGLVFGTIATIILRNIPDDSTVVLGIASVVINIIAMFISFRCSIKTTFKKRIMKKEDVGPVMKTVLGFVIIICILNVIMDFIEVNSTVKEIEEEYNNSKLKSYTSIAQEALLETIYDTEEEREEYKELQKQKEEEEKALFEKEIDKAKKEGYTFLFVVDIAISLGYVGAILLQKKEIEKNAI